MTAPWRKAIRDLWQSRTRTVLVVAAIALALAGFSAVLSTWAILTRALNDSYRSTNPASATIRTDAIDETLLSAVAKSPGVAIAEPRRTVAGRIRAADGDWRGLVLFVVKDFGAIRVSTLKPEKGAWPPAAGEILIERDAFQVAGCRIGDRVTVRTTNGQDRKLLVGGSVHDVGQAQARMENLVYGYITLETLEGLGEQPFLDQMKIVVSGDRSNEAHVRQVADDVRRLVENLGHPVSSVDVPAPGKHPHADIMGLLLAAMSSFGFFVVALSGVLIVNLMAALMGTQIRQIGVMKALGGSRWQIAKTYLGSAVVLGGAAIAGAAAPAVLGTRELCRGMSVFLNFDIESYAVPAWVYLVVAAIGFVVPLAAAWYPVWKGSGVPVREALDDFGTSRNAFGATRFDRALAGIGGPARPLLLAVRNSFRKRSRVALTVATMATGGVFFMSALNIRSSMIHTIDRLLASRKFDLTVSMATLSPAASVERAIRATPGIRRSECWIATTGSPSGLAAKPTARASGPHGGGGPDGDRFSVIALPPRTEFLYLNIVEGRNLADRDADAIVVNTALAARRPEMRVGRTVSFRMGPAQTSWRVVGISREPFSPPVAYIPRSFFDERHPGMTNSARLVLDRTDRSSIARVRAALEENLVREGIRPLSISSKEDSRVGFDQHMVMIYVLLIVVSVIIGGVGGLGLATTMSLNVFERRRELGVLRAVGATTGAICGIVVAEGCTTALIAWAAAAAAAWPVSRVIGDALFEMMLKTGLDFSVEPRGIFVWLVFCLAVGALASILPAANASRSTVREALAYE